MVGKFVLVGTGADFVFFFTSYPSFSFIPSIPLAICLCFGCSLHLGSGINFCVGLFVCLRVSSSGVCLVCLGNVFHVLWGSFFGDGGPHCGFFYFFSWASLRICLGKWCTVWVGL